MYKTCDKDYYKLGCYRDKYYPRTLPQLLFTDRDPLNPSFQENVDWKNWDQYIHRFVEKHHLLILKIKIKGCVLYHIFDSSLACRCANEARNRNYTMFGLQYYGECWAGSGSCDTFNRFGKSQLCYSQKYKECDNQDETECVGGPHANYVYLITE